jgi:hypothetical protein
VPTDFPTGAGQSQNGNQTGSNDADGAGGTRAGTQGGNDQGGNDASGIGGGQGQGAEGEQGERTAATSGGGAGDATGGFGDPSQAGQGAAGQDAQGEFDRSLGDFDQVMKSEQDKIARTGGGTAADRVFKQAGGNGTEAGDEAGNGGANGSVAQAGGEGEQQEQGGSSGGASGAQQGGSGAKAEVPTDTGPDQTVASVQGCADQDKVARQLCEAATKEKDPFLRASLWDEYNQYKKILAKQ